MRRFSLPMLLVLLVGLAGPAAAGTDVYLNTMADQGAFATWLRMNGDRGHAYVAGVFRVASPEGNLRTYAFVAHGPCWTHRGDVVVVGVAQSEARGAATSEGYLACRFTGYERRVGLEAFFMDPLMATARLSMRAGGDEHTVTWVGQDAPFPLHHLFVAESGLAFGFVDTWTGAGRDATAEATLFGRRMKTAKWEHWGFLCEGIGAFGGWGNYFYGASPSGGKLSFTRTFALGQNS